MTNIALDEKDEICGNCYLHSKQLGVCLLTGEEVMFSNTCAKWVAWDTCKSCLIDYSRKEEK